MLEIMSSARRVQVDALVIYSGKMGELESVFESARLGLRQDQKLSEALEQIEVLEKELEVYRNEREIYDGMKELVRMQETELEQLQTERTEERAVLEQQLLDSNIRRVNIEEELDNMKHWQEAELPGLEKAKERLAELEPEFDDLIHQLTDVKIRMAEMDEANMILAQELHKLRQHGSNAK